MKRSFKILIFTVVVVLIIFILAMIGKKDKLNNTINEYGSDITYTDDSRKYISSIEMTFNIETDDTFEEEIQLDDNIEHKIDVVVNELSKDSKIILIDEQGNEICNKQLKSKETEADWDELKLKGGKYKLKVKLSKETKGALEISFDE